MSFYFHNPLGALMFLLGIVVGIIILIVWLLLTFKVGEPRRSDQEKVNPLAFDLDNESRSRED